MRYLRITSFDQFKQYRDDRPLKWIKLPVTLPDDYAFSTLSETSRFHLVMIWLQAAKYKNKLPDDAQWIGQRIGATSPVDLEALKAAGFLEDVRTDSYETVRNVDGIRTDTTKSPYLEQSREEKEQSREEGPDLTIPLSEKGNDRNQHGNGFAPVGEVTGSILDRYRKNFEGEEGKDE